MVLRGAQFQRLGPAGCTFLTRRVLFSTARFMHGQLMRFHSGISATILTKDSRRMARVG